MGIHTLIMTLTSMVSPLFMIILINLPALSTSKHECLKPVNATSPDDAVKQCDGELRIFHTKDDNKEIIRTLLPQSMQSHRIWNGYLLKTPYLVYMGCYNFSSGKYRYNITENRMHIAKCWNICYSKHEDYLMAIKGNKCVCFAEDDIHYSAYSDYQYDICEQKSHCYKVFKQSNSKINSTKTCLTYRKKSRPVECKQNMTVVCMSTKGEIHFPSWKGSWLKGIKYCSKASSTLITLETAKNHKEWENNIWLNERRYQSNFIRKDANGMIDTRKCQSLILKNSKLRETSSKCNKIDIYACQSECTKTNLGPVSTLSTKTFSPSETTKFTQEVSLQTAAASSKKPKSESRSNSIAVLGGTVVAVCTLLSSGIIIGILKYMKRKTQKQANDIIQTSPAPQLEGEGSNEAGDQGHGAHMLDRVQGQRQSSQKHEYSTISDNNIRNEGAEGCSFHYHYAECHPVQNVDGPTSQLSKNEQSLSVYETSEQSGNYLTKRVDNNLSITNNKQVDSPALYYILETKDGTPTENEISDDCEVACMHQYLKKHFPVEDASVETPALNDTKIVSVYELATRPFQTRSQSEHKISLKIHHTLEKGIHESTQWNEENGYNHLERKGGQNKPAEDDIRDSTYAHVGQDVIDDGTYAHAQHIDTSKSPDDKNYAVDSYSYAAIGKNL